MPTLQTKYSGPRVPDRSPTWYSRIQPSCFTNGWQMWRFPSPAKYTEGLAAQKQRIKQAKDSDSGNSSHFNSGQNTSRSEDLTPSPVSSPDQTLETLNFRSSTLVSHTTKRAFTVPYKTVTGYPVDVVEKQVVNKPYNYSGRNTYRSGTPSQISKHSSKRIPPNSYSINPPNACSATSNDSEVPIPPPASYNLPTALASTKTVQSRNLPSSEKKPNFIQKVQEPEAKFLDIITWSSVTEVTDFLNCVRKVSCKIQQTEINYLQLKFRIETLLTCFSHKQAEVRGLDLLIAKLCNAEDQNIKHQRSILKELGMECIRKLMDNREKADAAIATCVKYRLLVRNIVNFPLDMFSDFKAAIDKLRQYRSKISYLQGKSPWLIKECNVFKFQYENFLTILRDVEHYCLPASKR